MIIKLYTWIAILLYTMSVVLCFLAGRYIGRLQMKAENPLYFNYLDMKEEQALPVKEAGSKNKKEIK